MNWFAKKVGGDRKESPGTNWINSHSPPEHYEQRPPCGEGCGKQEAGGMIQPGTTCLKWRLPDKSFGG